MGGWLRGLTVVALAACASPDATPRPPAGRDWALPERTEFDHIAWSRHGLVLEFGDVELWDPAVGTVRWQRSSRDSDDWALSPDASTLAVLDGSDERRVILVDLATGTERAAGEAARFRRLHELHGWTEAGLLLGGANMPIRAVAPDATCDARLCPEPPPRSEAPWCLPPLVQDPTAGTASQPAQFSPDGGWVAQVLHVGRTPDDGWTLEVSRVDGSEPRKTQVGAGQVTWAPDSGSLVVWGGPELTFYDLDDLAPRGALPLEDVRDPRWRVSGVGWSPDGRRLAWISGDRHGVVSLPRSLRSRPGPATGDHVAFSPASDLVALVRLDYRMRLLDAETGEVLAQAGPRWVR